MPPRINIFDTISNDAGSRIRSRNWYQNKIAEMSKRGLVTQNKLIKYSDMYASTVEVGSMYMFVYDAKAKNTLPVWDAFPLVIPFSMNNNLFTGFNLHYLPEAVRWTLLKTLLNNQDIASVRRLSKDTQLKMNYSVLKNSSHMPILKPTIHSYLWDHVVSMQHGKFLKIHPANWHMSILLPVAKFQYN